MKYLRSNWDHVAWIIGVLFLAGMFYGSVAELPDRVSKLENDFVEIKTDVKWIRLYLERPK